MKFLQWSKDGGPESNVEGFFIIEIKWLFSIAILRFNEGMREDFHSHDFNAVTLPISGDMEEQSLGEHSTWRTETEVKPYVNWKWKLTRKTKIHRVKVNKTGYCLTLRGKWGKTWWEYNRKTHELKLLGHGRKILRLI